FHIHWLHFIDENTNFSLNKYTPSNNVIAGDDEASDEQPIMHSSKTEVQASAETSFEPRKRLEKLLDTPARIYYQGVSPVGSDKPNIVVPRVWYYAQQGVKNFVTEIGVGPRGISRWNCSIEDLNEYEAIICCFGENSKMKINSTKSMLGHLVGASGVVKAVATIKVTDKLYEWVDLSVL
ncbi:tryptophan synthase beta chain 2, partial [Tanacetum coccineum]